MENVIGGLSHVHAQTGSRLSAAYDRLCDFDILDRLKSSYDQVMTGDIQAQVSVFGKECLCAFAVTESSLDTSILHITLLQPISDMTKEDEQLVLLYLMEHILLHIDEVLVH